MNGINIIKAIVLTVLLIVVVIPGLAKEQAIVGLADHELGDQTLSISAGALFPLPFFDFEGRIYSSNQFFLGGAGSLQWNAYLSPAFRIGLELAGTFSFGPDEAAFLMVPITAKAGYVFNYDRFEFPVFIGIGTNIIKYDSESLIDLTLAVKPGFSVFYRYDSNFSFGFNVEWLWSLEFPARAGTEPAIMGNSLIVSPSLFYNF